VWVSWGGGGGGGGGWGRRVCTALSRVVRICQISVTRSLLLESSHRYSQSKLPMVVRILRRGRICSEVGSFRIRLNTESMYEAQGLRL